MKTIWFALLLFVTIATGHGQTPQATPFPPFQLNLRVVYPGEKDRPDYAAFIYKMLRAIPNVVLVDENPDAILMITEAVNGKQYGCTFTILRPATPDVKREVEVAVATAPQSDNPNDMLWARLLQKDIRGLKPMYYWGNTWTIINESPKAALTAAFKLLDVRFVEKERRADEDARRYLRDHPYTPLAPLRDSASTPMPRRTPEPWTPPSSDFMMASPTPTPVPLFSPDPFPAKP